MPRIQLPTNPFAPPPGASVNGHSVPPSMGPLYSTLGYAEESVSFLDAAIAAIGTGVVSFVDAIASGEAFPYAINPAPTVPPSLESESIWAAKAMITSNVVITTATSTGNVELPKGTIFQLDEFAGALMARASNTLSQFSAPDKNRVQVPGTSGATARMQSVTTSLAFAYLLPDANDPTGPVLLTAYWVAASA